MDLDLYMYVFVACPPFAFQQGSRCITHPRLTKLTYDESQTTCEEFSWVTTGSLMMPNDRDEYDIIPFLAQYEYVTCFLLFTCMYIPNMVCIKHIIWSQTYNIMLDNDQL